MSLEIYLTLCPAIVSAIVAGWILKEKYTPREKREIMYVLCMGYASYAICYLFYFVMGLCGYAVQVQFMIGDLGALGAQVFLITGSLMMLKTIMGITGGFEKQNLLALLFPLMLAVISIVLIKSFNTTSETVLVLIYCVVYGICGYLALLTALHLIRSNGSYRYMKFYFFIILISNTFGYLEKIGPLCFDQWNYLFFMIIDTILVLLSGFLLKKGAGKWME